MKRLHDWVETLFFRPTLSTRIISFFLLPLSFLYGFYMLVRRLLARPKDYGIPIVSIGNLLVGGSGKTPFIIELAKRYDNVCVISRGYGRRSKGMVLVSQNGHIRTDVFSAGDEAMLIAKSTNATVIVSKDRVQAIKKAKELDSRLILLDDGFNRVTIKKFDLLLFPKHIPNSLPFPSGPFREFAFSHRFADAQAVENRDFFRKVSITNQQKTMVLVTALANPRRLDPYLPEGVVKKVYFSDHAYFDTNSLRFLLQQYKADSILATQKDAVKIDPRIPLSTLNLRLRINDDVYEKIEAYLRANMV
ncbi:MAG: tetraacyldisaccharide 4'-kinase [Campylobacterota bacterium]